MGPPPNIYAQYNILSNYLEILLEMFLNLLKYTLQSSYFLHLCPNFWISRTFQNSATIEKPAFKSWANEGYSVFES